MDQFFLPDKMCTIVDSSSLQWRHLVCVAILLPIALGDKNPSFAFAQYANIFHHFLFCHANSAFKKSSYFFVVLWQAKTDGCVHYYFNKVIVSTTVLEQTPWPMPRKLSTNFSTKDVGGRLQLLPTWWTFWLPGEKQSVWTTTSAESMSSIRLVHSAHHTASCV